MQSTIFKVRRARAFGSSRAHVVLLLGTVARHPGLVRAPAGLCPDLREPLPVGAVALGHRVSLVGLAVLADDG
jgi:hypothetical protein